jgi:acetyl-CoA C-acetyltransferase
VTDILIAGVGQVPVGEHWGLSLRTLAARAIQAARRDAGGLKPDALYVGNLLAPVVSHQANLGALIAGDTALTGIEAYTIEAAEASSAAAFHVACLAIQSGYVDSALVVGVEKVTDKVGSGQEAAISHILDFDYEGVAGLTPTSQAALLMQRYLHENGVQHSAFADFASVPQANAVGNPNAYFHKALGREMYEKAEAVCEPLNLFDIAPLMDGAAALLLTRADLLPKDSGHLHVRVVGSAVSVDALSLHDRSDPLAFLTARQSLDAACCQAGILPRDTDFFELTDSYSIYSCLSLEAAGYARKGEGWKLSAMGTLGEKGGLRISTMGGCKGRGNVLGATGTYQLVEATLQLRGEAGQCQVPKAKKALVQSLGGAAATAVTHVLERI